MTRSSRFFVFSVSCLSVLLVAAMAGRQNGQGAVPEPTYVPTATIKDLMLSFMAPSADFVWASVGTVVLPDEVVERVPRTDTEWADVRSGAIRLVEAANLLMMPGRRIARPGETSADPAVYLEPDEIDAIKTRDSAAWAARVAGFHESALALLGAVEARDPGRIFEIGSQLHAKCEGCHFQYWYPNQVLPPGYGPSR
jgi:hypothetical protein